MLNAIRVTFALLAAYFLATITFSSAQTPSAPPQTQSPAQSMPGQTPSPSGAKVYFINLNDTHRHFGNGQTEAMITLPPGKHSLQLVLGDWSHIAQVPPVTSDVITVTVR